MKEITELMTLKLESFTIIFREDLELPSIEASFMYFDSNGKQTYNTKRVDVGIIKDLIPQIRDIEEYCVEVSADKIKNNEKQ